MATEPSRLFFDKILQEKKQTINTSNLIIAEALCKKCSICCRNKIWVRKESGYFVKILETGCKFLGNDSLCTVYNKRHKVTDTCVSITDALLNCILPKTCGYVEENWDKIKDWYKIPL